MGELESFFVTQITTTSSQKQKGCPSSMQDCKFPTPISWQQPVHTACQGSTWCLQARGYAWSPVSWECLYLLDSTLPRRPNQAQTLKQALASDLFPGIIQAVCSNLNLRCWTFHFPACFPISLLTHLGSAEMLRIL